MSAPRKRVPRKAAVAGGSQRERLLGRPRPSAPYRLLVDVEAVEGARAELARVQRETRQTLLRDGASERDKKVARERVEAAEAAVDACYETLTLRALPPRRAEELAAAHPPTEEQLARAKTQRERAKQRGEETPDWPQWNDDTFWPEMLSETVEGNMTAEDWQAFLAENVSDGERRGLRLAVLAVNEQERAADPLVIPKGLTEILSSRLS